MTVSTITEQLQALYELYEQMTAWAEQKKEAIIENRVHDITRISQIESKLIKQLKEHEAIREQAVERTSRELGSARALDVTEMLGRLPEGGDKRALTDARDRLAGLVAKLRKMNELNQQLLEHSLSFINYSIDLLTDTQPEVVYHHPQQQAAGRRAALFETRA